MSLRTMIAGSVVTLVVAMSSVGCTSETSSGPSGTSGTSGTMTDTLYTRLGGNAGIKTAVHAVVVEELKDPELASYFFFQVSKPVPAGHPNVDQVEECFVLLLGNAAGGPEVYPATVSGGFKCRSMIDAHASLGIPGGVFTKFNMIAASVLKGAGVKDADLKVVGSVLEGTRPDVAQDKTRDVGMFNKKP